MFAMLTPHTASQAVAQGVYPLTPVCTDLQQHSYATYKYQVYHRTQREHVVSDMLLWLADRVQSARLYCDDMATAAKQVTKRYFAVPQYNIVTEWSQPCRLYGALDAKESVGMHRTVV